jgi:hypothetical protein
MDRRSDLQELSKKVHAFVNEYFNDAHVSLPMNSPYIRY